MDKITSFFSQGKIVVYPTDTVYGLGCRADDNQAVEVLYKIKKRTKNKPFLVLVSDLAMTKKYFKIDSRQLDYLKNNWPGPISFLLDSQGRLAQGGEVGLAVRLPKNNFLTKMIRRIGVPIISTSLNLSGGQTITDIKEISSYLDVSEIDLVIDVGPIQAKASSIIDLRDMDNIKTIRK